jgi:hypothetical protein
MDAEDISGAFSTAIYLKKLTDEILREQAEMEGSDEVLECDFIEIFKFSLGEQERELSRKQLMAIKSLFDAVQKAALNSKKCDR